jgi:hypothetical protein
MPPQIQNSGSQSMLSRLVGGRSLRYNRLLDKLGAGSFVAKIPRDFGADEENVVLGLSATPTTIAAGATATLTVNAPRDCILRRLIVAELDTNSLDFVITAIQVEGKSYTLGGVVPGVMFAATNFASPAEFDVPVQGGTPISITVTNTAAAGGSFVAAFTID